MIRYALLAAVALILTGCATWTPETTTAVVAGAGSALLAFARSLLDAGVLTEEQFAKLAAQAGSVQTAIDATNAALQAIGQAMSSVRGDVAAAKIEAAAKWGTEEVLTATGVASAVSAGAVNALRNRARVIRGEPVGPQHAPTTH